MTKRYKYFGIAEYSDGTMKTSRTFVDPEAFSRWANRQFHKDEDVTISQYAIDRQEGCETYLICTWHA